MNKKLRVLNLLCVVIALMLCFTGCGNGGDSIVTDSESRLSNGENVETEQKDSSVMENIGSTQEYISSSEITVPDNQVVATDLKPSEGLEFESNGDGTCTIKGIGVCTDKDIVIPEKSPAGDTVTLIGEYAFMSIKDVDSVTLVNYTYEIDKRAFQYGEFSTLNIIGGSPIVKESAFSSCEYLTSVSFTDCNIQADKYAFYSCGKDAGVTFTNCSGVIKENAFQYGDYINLSITNCELEIGKSAFSSCEALTSIVFTDSTINVDEYAFYSCGKDADVTFSNCTGAIDERAFQYGDFQSLTISSCELEIEKSAFSSCEALTSIAFTDSTIEASEYAFYSCGDSAMVEVSNCSLVLDDRAFQYSSLDSVTITGSKVETGASVFSSCEDLTVLTIDCDSVILDEYAFYGCEDLVDVSICENSKSDNEIKIDDRAFQYCKRLETVNIGDGNIEIGEAVFSGCADGLSITVAGKSYTADAIKGGLK